MNEILFLPDTYLITLIITGIIIGIVFPSRNHHVRVALFLFTLYMLPQIFFRWTEDALPLRAVGQYVYYVLFSAIAIGTQYVQERVNLQRKNGSRPSDGG